MGNALNFRRFVRLLSAFPCFAALTSVLKQAMLVHQPKCLFLAVKAASNKNRKDLLKPKDMEVCKSFLQNTWHVAYARVAPTKKALYCFFGDVAATWAMVCFTLPNQDAVYQACAELINTCLGQAGAVTGAEVKCMIVRPDGSKHIILFPTPRLQVIHNRLMATFKPHCLDYLAWAQASPNFIQTQLPDVRQQQVVDLMLLMQRPLPQVVLPQDIARFQALLDTTSLEFRQRKAALQACVLRCKRSHTPLPADPEAAALMQQLGVMQLMRLMESEMAKHVNKLLALQQQQQLPLPLPPASPVSPPHPPTPQTPPRTTESTGMSALPPGRNLPTPASALPTTSSVPGHCLPLAPGAQIPAVAAPSYSVPPPPPSDQTGFVAAPGYCLPPAPGIHVPVDAAPGYSISLPAPSGQTPSVTAPAPGYCPPPAPGAQVPIDAALGDSIPPPAPCGQTPFVASPAPGHCLPPAPGAQVPIDVALGYSIPPSAPSGQTPFANAPLPTMARCGPPAYDMLQSPTPYNASARGVSPHTSAPAHLQASVYESCPPSSGTMAFIMFDQVAFPTSPASPTGYPGSPASSLTHQGDDAPPLPPYQGCIAESPVYTDAAGASFSAVPYAAALSPPYPANPASPLLGSTAQALVLGPACLGTTDPPVACIKRPATYLAAHPATVPSDVGVAVSPQLLCPVTVKKMKSQQQATCLPLPPNISPERLEAALSEIEITMLEMDPELLLLPTDDGDLDIPKLLLEGDAEMDLVLPLVGSIDKMDLDDDKLTELTEIAKLLLDPDEQVLRQKQQDLELMDLLLPDGWGDAATTVAY